MFEDSENPERTRSIFRPEDIAKPTCVWCGKVLSNIKNPIPGMPRYCSKSCDGARNLYLWLFLAITMPIGFAAELALSWDGLLEGLTLYSAISYALLGVNLVVAAISWTFLYLGIKKRREGRQSGEHEK